MMRSATELNQTKARHRQTKWQTGMFLDLAVDSNSVWIKAEEELLSFSRGSLIPNNLWGFLTAVLL